MDNRSYAGAVTAPDFPPGLDWLNTDKPISLKDLRGKIVILDFWTYCCINCMHILPQLLKLEKKYPNELVVIGVHSAKFPSEQQTSNVQKAILRYEVEHPVVNDRDFRIWQQYSVRAWPTLMFVDPFGKVIGNHEGEFTSDVLAPVIATMIAEFDGKGAIDRTPRTFKLEREKEQERSLSFPGKILADPSSGMLYVADSNHNRILVTSLDGETRMAIGSGEPGLNDGNLQSALFNRPQGVALNGTLLYVADTENHAIRLVNLKKEKVSTIAGTGQQAATLHQGGLASSTQLSSPWDLAYQDDTLYIAMAGFHQIWTFDLKKWTVQPFAGSGREFISDGPLLEATLAQPSSLSLDAAAKKLYFADSETSAVRMADLNSTGRVSTLVGTGLFDFGDVDGIEEDARLQHPLGVAYYDGKVYVADTYNNKIKHIYPKIRGCYSLLGSGLPGLKDGLGKDAQFHEPGGLSAADGKLYIADTNNHAIRVADIESLEVHTLEINI